MLDDEYLAVIKYFVGQAPASKNRFLVIKEGGFMDEKISDEVLERMRENMLDGGDEKEICPCCCQKSLTMLFAQKSPILLCCAGDCGFQAHLIHVKNLTKGQLVDLYVVGLVIQEKRLEKNLAEIKAKLNRHRTSSPAPNQEELLAVLCG